MIISKHEQSCWSWSCCYKWIEISYKSDFCTGTCNKKQGSNLQKLLKLHLKCSLNWQQLKQYKNVSWQKRYLFKLQNLALSNWICINISLLMSDDNLLKYEHYKVTFIIIMVTFYHWHKAIVFFFFFLMCKHIPQSPLYPVALWQAVKSASFISSHPSDL